MISYQRDKQNTKPKELAFTSKEILAKLEESLGVEIPSIEIEIVDRKGLKDAMSIVPESYGINGHSLVGGIIKDFMSAHVLGLYVEPVDKCFICSQNFGEASERMGVHPSDLIKLVTVHEHIHKIQHKVLAEWLGEHTHKEIGKLIEKENEAEDRGAIEIFTQFGEKFQALTNLMTVIEGHAEYVTEFSTGLKRKTNTKKTFAKFLLQWKLNQYSRGKDWFAYVHQNYDWATANIVWMGPDYLPSKQELENPEAWVSRVTV